MIKFLKTNFSHFFICSGDSRGKCNFFIWNKIFVYQCQPGTVHTWSIGLYASRTVFCKYLP